MAVYKLIRLSDNTEINLIEWDGETPFTPPAGTTLSPITGSSTDFTASAQSEEINHSGNFYGSLLGDVTGSFSGSNVISNIAQIKNELIVSGALNISGSFTINGSSYTDSTSGTSGTSGASGPALFTLTADTNDITVTPNSAVRTTGTGNNYVTSTESYPTAFLTAKPNSSQSGNQGQFFLSDGGDEYGFYFVNTNLYYKMGGTTGVVGGYSNTDVLTVIVSTAGVKLLQNGSLVASNGYLPGQYSIKLLLYATGEGFNNISFGFSDAGTSGTPGTSGTSGTPGSSGTSGTAGTSGTPGSSGTSGTAGTSGTGFNTIDNAGIGRVLLSDGTINAATASTAMVVNSNNVSITGSLLITGSKTIIGQSYLTGSLFITGSQGLTGYLGLEPVAGLTIPTNKSASYIYTSGSTNDLYFTQYQGEYTNTTRLRWIESNLSTGVLYGGVLSSTTGSTQFTVTGGEGIIVTQNAFTSSAPYPTIKLVSWPTQTLPITYSGSANITYVGVNNVGTIVQQNVPWGSTDINQYDTEIELGIILHLSGSVSNGVFNSPQIGYGHPQQSDDFMRSFGPLKISGHTLQASGSTLSIVKSGGRAYVAGANYLINPNHPSTVVENSVNVSKIYRSYTSGSTQIFDTGTSTSGYTVLDPTKRVDTATGLLTPVSTNKYSLQRVFWVPNSPRQAFIVYYGNAQYDSLIDAINAKDAEPFVESAYTATNAIFLGWIAIAGGASSLTNPADATIAPAGIFRSIGGIGSTGTTPLSTTLASLSDVSVGSRTAGDLLYYNGSQWESTKQLNANYGVTGSLNINGSLIINGTSYTAATSGTSGTSGANGSSGSSGTSGANGSSGSSGTSGANGSSGSSGTSGANGSSGSSGTTGSSGTSGANGSSGSSGTTGSSGTSGANGSSGSSGTSGTGFTTITNAVDNRVLTSDGTSNSANAETNLTFNGSTLAVTGNVTATSFTGSLQGIATTASYVLNAVSSSFATNSNTASYVLNAVSSSYALTASYAMNGGGGGGASVTNPGNNYIITSDGTAGGLVGETNLNFDGTIFNVTGSAIISATTRLTDVEERELTVVIGGTPTSLSLDLSLANVFEVTYNNNVNSFSIVNPPPTDYAGSFTLVTTGTGTPYPWNWGSAVTWSGGSAPSVTSTNGKRDIYGFISTNQGTNWYGFIGAQNL